VTTATAHPERNAAVRIPSRAAAHACIIIGYHALDDRA